MRCLLLVGRYLRGSSNNRSRLNDGLDDAVMTLTDKLAKLEELVGVLGEHAKTPNVPVCSLSEHCPACAASETLAVLTPTTTTLLIAALRALENEGHEAPADESDADEHCNVSSKPVVDCLGCQVLDQAEKALQGL